MDKRQLTNFEEVIHEPLYIQLYHYYKTLIAAKNIEAGTKLPSIRRCAAERRVSRTTVEGAYAQLAAEGYITAAPGSGYYVNELNYTEIKPVEALHYVESTQNKQVLYDFASAKVDYKSFNFDVWRRYIKSALRNTERLLSYGDPQGEYDLRVALANYVRERRGVVCTPEQIVIGAGVQTLLHILCALTVERSSIVFTGASFKQGKAIFEDRGFETAIYGKLNDDFGWLKKKESQIIYTSPSHATPWGDVMPMRTRLALLTLAKKHNCLIIEDDYDSEFNYYNRPTPSLQGLDGGQNVVYMSTFSKLLLPSLRMSFMVLPMQLMEKYREKGRYYNQTTSKTEQIALCQFIRDDHLERQIKKARKLYVIKKQLLCEKIEKVFGSQATAVSGSSGFLIQLEIKTDIPAVELVRRAAEVGVLVKVSDAVENSKFPRLLLSCSGVAEEEFEKALGLLKNVID